MKSKVTAFRKKFASLMEGVVLDCGAGEGEYTSLLSNATRVVSLDVEEICLRKISSECVLASATHLPFKEDAFDSVWACAVIEHVEVNVIPELVRVCKTGGKIGILTPNRNSPFDPLIRAAGLPGWRDHEGHVRLWTVDELARYGPVFGEVRFLPFLRTFFLRRPRLGHTLMLFISNTPDVKQLAKQELNRRACALDTENILQQGHFSCRG